jgi:DNA repair exonuclease SbcCD ATPase subunit
MSVVDYIPKDAILPENQNFCCLSLWMDDDKKTIKYVKVSGGFKNLEDAKEQVQLLKEPGHYNFVAEMGAWNAFDPLPNNKDLNDELNLMMHRYLINVHKNNLEFEKRKYEMMTTNVSENCEIKQNELVNEIKKLADLELQESTEEIENLKTSTTEYIAKIRVQIEKLNKKKEECLENEKGVIEKLSNIKIDESPVKQSSENIQNHNIPMKFDGVVKRKYEKIENQNWYCISFLVEDNMSLVGLKVNGCFDTAENAENHSRALRDINDSCSILIGELYKWQPFNPAPDSVEAGESEYANPQLNETMKNKRDNEKKAQLYHEFRKNDMVRKNLEESLNEKVSEKEEMNKKLENVKSREMKKTIESEVLTLEEQIKKLEEKKTEFTNKEAELVEKIGLFELKKQMEEKNMGSKILDV